MSVAGTLHVHYVAIIIQEAAKNKYHPFISLHSFFQWDDLYSSEVLEHLDNFVVVATVSHNRWNQHSLF
jgi:hypothetical protein